MNIKEFQKRKKELIDEYYTAEPRRQAEIAEELHELNGFLCHVPPAYKTVVRLKFVYDLTDEEIAERLNYSPRHIRRLISRALDREDE